MAAAIPRPTRRVVPLLLSVVLLVVVSGAGTAHAGGNQFTYPKYGHVVKRLLELNETYPDIVEVWNAQDEYGIGFPSMPCKDADGQNTPCKQWFIRLTDEKTLDGSRPEVFFSGNLHGDEQVGPPTLMALIELLVGNAAHFRHDKQASSSPGGLGPMGNLWLYRLIQTRSIVILPISNAIGYENIVRTEQDIDPNRDFPFATHPSKCMRTFVARSINEVWVRHMFQVAVTFHGGMQAIAYEWGSPNHQEHDSESPDDTAQHQIASRLSAYAGKYKGQAYPYGRLNPVVYYVRGGMEDWGYAAGWDTPSFVKCNPADNGGYPPAKTDYAKNNQLEAFRAFNMLVEASDNKRPYYTNLGTDEAMLTVEGPGDGHVPRNLRLALQMIDIVQPWIQPNRVSLTTLGTDPDRRRSLQLECSSGGSRRLRGAAHHALISSRVLTSSNLRLARVMEAASSPDTLPSTTYGTAALSYRQSYSQWLDIASCDHTLRFSVGWDVGGGYHVTNTQLLVGRWPAAVNPSEIYVKSADSDHSDVAAWKQLLSGAAEVSLGTTAVFEGSKKSGTTRWLDANFHDYGAEAYSTRFEDCTVLQSDHPTPPPAFEGDSMYARIDAYVAVVVATVDADWKTQTNPAPAVAPQSHIVNARTNPEWHKENNGHRVDGRVYFTSEPMFIAAGHLRDHCKAVTTSTSPDSEGGHPSHDGAPAPSASPKPASHTEPTPSPAPSVDHHHGPAQPSSPPSSTSVPQQSSGLDTSLVETDESTSPEEGTATSPAGLRLYAIVVGALLTVGVAVVAGIYIGRRSLASSTTSPPPTAHQERTSRSGGRRRQRPQTSAYQHIGASSRDVENASVDSADEGSLGTNDSEDDLETSALQSFGLDADSGDEFDADTRLGPPRSTAASASDEV